MPVNVGDLQVTIGVDNKKFDAAIDKATRDMAKFANNVAQHSFNIGASFLRIENNTNRLANLLQGRGIAPTKEAINAVKRAFREIELETKRHTNEMNRQAKEREKVSTNAGIFGGLSGGILVGGRLGFAGGYFGGRFGSAYGGALGASLGRGIGQFFNGREGLERGGALGGRLGGNIGGFAGFGMMMPVVFTAQKVFQLIQFSVEKIWEGMKAIGEITWTAVKAAFHLGLEYEKSVITLQTLLGSEEKGKNLYESIEKYAIKSPYRTSKLIGPAQTLLGSGVSEDNIMPVLSRIGDIAGGDYDRMTRLMKAFTDVMAKGVLQGEERRQFGNVGIGLKDFADTAGVSQPKFQKMMRAGQIDSNVVVETINRLTSPGGRFYNLSLNVATKTVGGALESIAETFEQFGSRIGRSFFQKFRVGENLRKFLDILENFDMSAIDRWMDRAAQGLSRLGKFFNVDIIKGGLETIFQKIHDAMPSWETVGKVIDEGLIKWIPTLVEGLKLAASAGISFVDVLLQITDAVAKVLSRMIDFIPGIKTHTDEDVKKYNDFQNMLKNNPDQAFANFKAEWMEGYHKSLEQGAMPETDENIKRQIAKDFAWKKANYKLEGINVDQLKVGGGSAFQDIRKVLETTKKFINNIPSVAPKDLAGLGGNQGGKLDNSARILKFTEEEKRINKQIQENFEKEENINRRQRQLKMLHRLNKDNIDFFDMERNPLFDITNKEHNFSLGAEEVNALKILQKMGFKTDINVDKMVKDYEKYTKSLDIGLKQEQEIINEHIENILKEKEGFNPNLDEGDGDELRKRLNNDLRYDKLLIKNKELGEIVNKLYEDSQKEITRLLKEELKNPNSKLIKNFEFDNNNFNDKSILENKEFKENAKEMQRLEQQRTILDRNLKQTQVNKQKSEENHGKIKTSLLDKLPMQAEKIVDDLEKRSLEGFTDFEKFSKYQDNLKIARFGKGGVAGKLIDSEYSQGLLENFNNLAKTLDKVGDRLPQTQYYGSSEAQATINNTILQNQTKDIQQQILDVLKLAEIENKAQTALNREMAAALKKIAGGDPLEDALDFMFN